MALGGSFSKLASMRSVNSTFSPCIPQKLLHLCFRTAWQKNIVAIVNFALHSYFHKPPAFKKLSYIYFNVVQWHCHVTNRKRTKWIRFVVKGWIRFIVKDITQQWAPKPEKRLTKQAYLTHLHKVRVKPISIKTTVTKYWISLMDGTLLTFLPE